MRLLWIVTAMGRTQAGRQFGRSTGKIVINCLLIRWDWSGEKDDPNILIYENIRNWRDRISGSPWSGWFPSWSEEGSAVSPFHWCPGPWWTLKRPSSLDIPHRHISKRELSFHAPWSCNQICLTPSWIAHSHTSSDLLNQSKREPFCQLSTSWFYHHSWA